MTLLTHLDGTPVPRIGVGCSNFGKRVDAATVAGVVRTALDLGAGFFDVADVYGGGTAESLLARGLRGRRDEALIATKFGHDTKEERSPEEVGGHPRNVVASAEASLRALETDRIDLFQLHVPDPRVPVADTLGALRGLVDQGKVRWAGCSNLTAGQLAEAADAAAGLGFTGFRTVQNEYSLLVREAEAEVLPWCRAAGVRFLRYFPRARGILTGKYRRDARVPAGSRVALMKPDKLFRFFTPRALDLVEDLVALGDRTGYAVLELAYGFLLAEPAVLSVISGAMSAEQVRANVAAAPAAAGLPPEVVAELRTLSAP